MKIKNNMLQSYYDGHYIDSGLSTEEREKIDKEGQEKNKKLKSWDDVSIND